MWPSHGVALSCEPAMVQLTPPWARMTRRPPPPPPWLRPGAGSSRVCPGRTTCCTAPPPASWGPPSSPKVCRRCCVFPGDKTDSSRYHGSWMVTLDRCTAALASLQSLGSVSAVMSAVVWQCDISVTLLSTVHHCASPLHPTGVSPRPPLNQLASEQLFCGESSGACICRRWEDCTLHWHNPAHICTTLAWHRRHGDMVQAHIAHCADQQTGKLVSESCAALAAVCWWWWWWTVFVQSA